jgi:hypothetical protein
MPTAHSSLLQWLQDQPEVSLLTTSPSINGLWILRVRSYCGGDVVYGSGTSYESACFNLLQQIRKS